MNGRNKWSVDFLIKLADYFNVSLDYIVYGKVGPREQTQTEERCQRKVAEILMESEARDEQELYNMLTVYASLLQQNHAVKKQK